MHFRFIASKLPSWPPPSHPKPAALKLLNEPSLGEERQGGPGPSPPMQCRSERKGKQQPPRPAFLRNGYIPQEGNYSSQFFSWPVMGALLYALLTVRDTRLGRGVSRRGMCSTAQSSTLGSDSPSGPGLGFNILQHAFRGRLENSISKPMCSYS